MANVHYTLPKISSYGQYSSGNYGAHTLLVEVGDIDLYFSYQTVVAFRSPDTGLVVSENDWGPTTGKHLNWISRDKKRTRRSEFERQLHGVLQQRGLVAA